MSVISSVNMYNQPCYQWRISTTQNIPTATSTTLTGSDTTVINQGNISFSSGVITINEPGIYEATASLTISSNTAGRRTMNIYHSGSSTFSYGHNSLTANQSGISAFNAKDLYDCSAGDTIHVSVYQDSGSTLTCPASTADADANIITICKFL